MFEKILQVVERSNAKLTGNLDQFFKRFAPFKELPFFATHFTDFTKVIIYSFFVLIPLLILKILFPYKRRFTYPILLILGIIGLSLFGIFLGFLQLLYGF
ncbi:hypothetical protein A2715_00200 [Candidatus Woesebacteria bacterium RIFCSPHIGHO2_01_FULL_39_32]|uniref:Uncharacterized protein n=2 Tax=Candidatus Woeseibacteriota TaxID=1752722 RepID=A0A0G0SYE3_9BACT|nr:MAG: hypothetical protein UT61_C0004G0019 [Candidatus Woesebacteria bacterium GW2011_GWA1_39_8]OGM03781.1 MAG: hypothetical protein A2124_00320 [Candidatus Woesebacteria bacterium GWB1_37_5]OGM24246.1 MAG: hypothetical protein A2715_00200 [Candidatus Woesebacteria bacterium RIFCSPHIGHO2_01_FULL_39_32]OGM35373.1 MAG: hypothetical protein A3F01_04555 [Candidatus Woesebacteria bacterium RIFCSPHIGHO2_12_FULL_38_11]OGM65317.1 MAG: hypothetical protein A2893_01155 [Candidatus Woesebacteria bacteri